MIEAQGQMYLRCMSKKKTNLHEEKSVMARRLKIHQGGRGTWSLPWWEEPKFATVEGGLEAQYGGGPEIRYDGRGHEAFHDEGRTQNLSSLS